MTPYTEQDLREALGAEAGEAPAPSAGELVARVHARDRKQRRLAVTATATIMIAAGLSIGLALDSSGPAVPAFSSTLGLYGQPCRSAGCRASAATIVQQELHHALRLPRVAPGGRCPVTPGENYDGPDVGGERYGKPPAWLVIGDKGDPAKGSTSLGRSDRKGWLAAEDVLQVNPAYRGAVSVRARHLDGSSAVSLGGAPGLPTYLLPATSARSAYPSNSDGSRTPPMTIWAKTPGCYGFQIDGQNFSETIVVNLTAPTLNP